MGYCMREVKCKLLGAFSTFPGAWCPRHPGIWRTELHGSDTTWMEKAGITLVVLSQKRRDDMMLKAL